MAFNITEMMATIGYYNGFHKPSHFFVRVTPPAFLAGRQINRDLEFLCEATNLPGLQLDTTFIRPMGYGTPEQRPTDTMYPQVKCDFFVDNGSQVLDYFYSWMGNIHNTNIDIRTSSTDTNLRYYEFAYPKEYEGVLEIYMFAGDGADVRKITLNQCFPVNVGDITLAWEINDQVSRVPVQFAYNSWSSELPGGPEVDDISQRLVATRNNLPGYTVT